MPFQDMAEAVGRVSYLESSELAPHVLQLSQAAEPHEDQDGFSALTLHSV